MTSRASFVVRGALVLAVASLLVARGHASPVFLGSQASHDDKNRVPERLTAFAVDMNPAGATGTDPVDIVITRWSTPDERDKLVNTLLENGASKLADVLDDMPQTGLLRTPQTTLGVDFHFASHRTLPDGSERIVLLTNRPVNYWSTLRRPELADYPFTMIEIRLAADGKGEGKLSLATRISADKENNTIQLENYDAQPVLLKSVTRGSA